MIPALSDIRPEPSVARLVAELVPPVRFGDARLDTYVPDGEHPSQAEAKETVRRFADGIGSAGGRGLFGLRRRRATASGLYLDGGFGVGKTHLLVSAYHLAGGHRTYGTFIEYTNLIGALGYIKCVELLAASSLVCIDEFELDDPGDTLMMTRLIRELSDRGVAVMATSNTLPDALGEGRFAAEDFLREIQAMSDRFTVVRIDGPDYRHREGLAELEEISEDEVRAHAEATAGSTLDALPDLLEHLESVHPSRYGRMLDDVAHAHLTGLETIDRHHPALRMVVLIDRLYDREVPVHLSGLPADRLFSADLLSSGYRKKYWRALSRLTALARDGQQLRRG